ncbi:outer membrane protein [Rhizomicrobium palustre]|uniref:Outer membrane protein n=1 Tax=Rhizomicrobium palustre TaxID=189966 RepID=A0A846MUZ7_9PROT|nr:OmpW family outer membrane protein [Rhizomicrobium palustre]NIK87011.1 outer membrane protein [Rhizomicrobium palustre]
MTRLYYRVLAVFAAFFAFTTAATAEPYEAGTILLRLRAVEVVPDVSSTVSIGGKVSITDTVIPEADITYFFTPHWSVEAIAGTNKHAIYYNGSTKLANVWLLPPTVTLQYHFDQIGAFKPYLGAGPNFTLFYDRSTGPLGKLRTTDNWGFALQAGTDIALDKDERYFLNIDVKRLWLSTQASFTGAPVTASVNINPWLIGTGIGVRF